MLVMLTNSTLDPTVNKNVSELNLKKKITPLFSTQRIVFEMTRFCAGKILNTQGTPVRLIESFKVRLT